MNRESSQMLCCHRQPGLNYQLDFQIERSGDWERRFQRWHRNLRIQSDYGQVPFTIATHLSLPSQRFLVSLTAPYVLPDSHSQFKIIIFFYHRWLQLAVLSGMDTYILMHPMANVRPLWEQFQITESLQASHFLKWSKVTFSFSANFCWKRLKRNYNNNNNWITLLLVNMAFGDIMSLEMS